MHADNFIMYSLLLLSSLLRIHITTCTVYTVSPDDHYYPNTTCHHCHNLQHYLLNVTKYFTSNTQLFFLPGLHHLHTDLIIQNVHNISLIGSTADGTTPNTVIQLQCNISSILISNATKLTVRDIIINASCILPLNIPNYVPLTIKDCSFVLLCGLKIYQDCQEAGVLHNFALVAKNIMGSSYFNHVMCYDEVQLLYSEINTDKKHHSLSINNARIKIATLNMLQNSYSVTVRITNLQVKHIFYPSRSIIHAEEIRNTELLMINCKFTSNTYLDQLFLFASTRNGSVQFINCQFINNIMNSQIFSTESQTVLIKLSKSISIEFSNCEFYSENEGKILEAFGERLMPICVVVRNTKYNAITLDDEIKMRSDITGYISLSDATLTLQDLVSFKIAGIFKSIITLTGISTITISGNVKFSHSYLHTLINFNDSNAKYIIMKENSILNISYNKVWSLFDTNLPTIKFPYPFCFFQYFTSSPSKQVEKRNFLITFSSNQCNHTFSSCYDNIPIINCFWLPNSTYTSIIPLEVNNYYTEFINNSGVYKLSQINTQSSLCVCTDEIQYDCHINNLGYLYPGQTLVLRLHHNKVDGINAVVVKTDIHQHYVTPCIVLDISEHLQLIENNCTKLNYTIGFLTDNWCELFLKLASDSDDYLNIYYIWQLTCPIGFLKIDKRCQCDPVLVQYGITICNINDQTILRPANSWISTTTHNNSYIYHISLHCPFHYCLPHSSHLNLSTPNSQCQFYRSGLLCGHCQQGLSAVFSTPHCQHCSNIYLLLIIPIAIAGLVLVLLLFVLNLTVTDGTINGFILYVNIISINTPVFFTELNHFTPTYTFISLANLDLGIQTCFYNGMDDYAKMWLQLTFPFYLIFIATLIITTSRYSTIIQRLTARRALPVLATLFLLSYTKILRIVSSVLFFYSTITHLPSKHTTLVWSVDANVPLFGVRFTILFIVCLILFLILVPFNVILLFTRTLSRFRLIDKFKPLLDAYQGPYKDKFYYWIGLQLVIRALFFGISSLDKNVNLTVSIILFSIVGGIHGIACPFKRKYKNHQELALILNLQVLYAISQYSQDINTTAVNVMVAIAAVHFTLIIIYHMITYMHGGVIRNKIQLSISNFTTWVTRLHHKSQPQKFKLQDNIRDNIPEVAFNFRDHREPLIGKEYD